MFLMSLLTASIVKNKKFFKKNIDQTSKVSIPNLNLSEKIRKVHLISVILLN